MVRQALAERGVGRVDAAFVGWAKEIRHLVVCLPCKARLRPPCTLRTQAHTQGGLTTKQMAGPEAQELIAAMGGVRILVQMCSVPQPEEVRAMSPDTLLLLYLFRSSAPMFGKALRERFCRTQVY